MGHLKISEWKETSEDELEDRVKKAIYDGGKDGEQTLVCKDMSGQKVGGKENMPGGDTRNTISGQEKFSADIGHREDTEEEKDTNNEERKDDEEGKNTSLLQFENKCDEEGKDNALLQFEDKKGSEEGKDNTSLKPSEPPPRTCFGCKSREKVWCHLIPSSLTSRFRQLKKWILDDLSKSHLIWIKLIFFFQSASLVVLYPYLVIHMRSLGLSTEEIAVVNGVIPAADVVGPPLAGFVADRIGNFRLFMSGLTLISGFSSLLLLLIPPKSTQIPVVNRQLSCCPISMHNLFCSDELNTTTYWATELLNTQTPLSGSYLTCTNPLQQRVLLSVSSFSSSSNYNNSFNSSLFYMEECYKLTLCSGTHNMKHANWETNLWAYVGLRAAIDVLRASSIMMFEGAVVITIKQLGGDYGLQKLFGTFGSIIWGPISGQIIDMASTSSGTENYAPVFWIFFIMRLICAGLILKLNLSFKKPAKKVFKNLCKLICQPHIFMFLVIFFICGAVWGFLESYLFWFLEDLGSTKLTMGISLAVGTVAGIPLTIGSGAIIRRLGNTNVIVVALALYCLRLLGYSIINSPLQSLGFEILKPFGNSLLMIAAMTYAKNNADISNMASLEGVMGALYFGIGKALGSLTGGLAIERIGVRNTFRTFSLVSLVAASVYLCFTLLHDRRKVLDNISDVEKALKEKEGSSESRTEGKPEDIEQGEMGEHVLSDKMEETKDITKPPREEDISSRGQLNSRVTRDQTRCT